MEYLIVVLALYLCATWWFRWRIETRRRVRWEGFAREMGWQYQSGKSRKISRSFGFLNRLQRGTHRYATDILYGNLDGQACYAFTHNHQMGFGGNEAEVRTHKQAVMVWRLPVDGYLPELTIAPEGKVSRLGNKLVKRNIDLESVEFSRAFEVKSKEKQLAYDVCSPQMMDYLLEVPSVAMEIEGQWIATIFHGELRIEHFEARLEHLEGIIDRLPQFWFSES